MFNMKNVGFQISKLRKANNMTQMELADRMGISFQAVSNWERGNSMPDISKLPELAQIFNVTMDEILCEKSELIESVANNTISEYLENNTVTPQQLADVAPLLKTEQVDMIFERVEKEMENAQEMHDVGFDDVLPLLPFLNNDTINELARKAAETGSYKKIYEIAPFVKRNALEQIVRGMEAERKSISDLVPFVSEALVEEIAKNRYREEGIYALEDIVPFIPKETLQEIAKEEYEKQGLKHFESIAPFLERGFLNGIAQKAIEKDGIKAISGIAPFLDRDMLSEYVKEKYL